MALPDEIRRYWDDDAPTYDHSPDHHPQSPVVQAAWTAALARLLPPAPAAILDCGAGTGFLSLIAARLGHRVTALDLSPVMLARLEAAATAEALDITIITGPAESPPTGFDAVMERHLLWTVPDPGATVTAWRAAAPSGRLILLESLWGSVDPIERVRQQVRHRLDRLRGVAPAHHGEYPDAVRSALPLGRGTPPATLVDLVAAAGWPNPRLERLRDIEWAERRELAWAERMIGVTPRLAVTAG